MAFQLQETVNKNRVFLFKRSELEGRLDPFCYIPSLVFLDKLIKSKTDKRLNDFAVSYSSGATPSKSESDIHYTTKKDGYPFVRVQNLSTSGELCFDNMKYISKETHNGLLNRSKVFAGDLLVKITGVGRMAVASVAPKGFEGNINQHIVVIRTGEMAISQNLAAFINLDCIEKLASKRATGGTRPALDYPALFSLPVISDEHFRAKMSEASAAKKQKEAQAKQLIGSIDTYLLNELGIDKKVDYPNVIENRIVKSSFRCITGQRWDPLFHCGDMFSFVCNAQPYIDFPQLNNLVLYFQTGFAAGRDDQGEECSGIIQIRPTNINDDRELVFHRNVYIESSELNARKTDMLNCDEVLFNNTNSQEQVGKTSYFDLEGDYFCSNHITRIATKAELLNPKYLCYILNLYQHQKCFFKLCTNWNNQSGVGVDVLQKIPIPLPPLKKQNEIAAHIQGIRDQAKQLRAEAAAGLEQAKREVETMIIGKEAAV